METLDDLILELAPVQNFLPDRRLIEVDLKNKLNFNTFSFNSDFAFNKAAITNVSVDGLYKSRLIISLNKNIVLPNVENALTISYSATSISGDKASGKILLANTEFEIGVVPIDIELDFCCALPDKLIINVRDYNGALPITLVSVGDNDEDAGTITLEDFVGNDYNEDYNEDFGTDPNKLIIYTFNVESEFWKSVEVKDRFQYNVTYDGKTASNFITIKNKLCGC